jgi:hypothetical protein
MRLLFQDQELTLSGVLYDTPYQIVHGLCALLVFGEGQARVFLEPDECLLIFDPTGVTVHYSPDGQADKSSEVVFQAEVAPPILVRRFLMALKSLEALAIERPEEFKHHWGFTPDLSKLEDLHRTHPCAKGI